MHRMFGHVLIAAALVFALNVVGSVSSYVESTAKPEALPAIAAAAAQPSSVSKSADVKTEPCRPGHTYEVTIDEKTSRVRVQDLGVDPAYRLGCARVPDNRMLCPDALVKYQMVTNNRVIPVSLRCRDGDSIEVTGRAVLTKAAGIQDGENTALDQVVKSMESKWPPATETLAAQNPTGIDTYDFYPPPSAPEVPASGGRFPGLSDELDDLAGGPTKPSPQQGEFGDLFFGGPSSALRPESPAGFGEPDVITHTEEEIAARSRFPEPPEPTLASVEPKTLRERMGKSAMRMLDSVDRWWEDFGKDTQDAATKQEETRQGQVSEDKNKTVEPNWEALRIEQGGDWADAKNALEDEQKAVTGDSRIPITQDDMDKKQREIFSRGITMLNSNSKDDLEKFNVTEELKRLDEKYYVPAESSAAIASARDEVARADERARIEMAALEAQAKQDQFEAEISRNIDREDVDLGVSMREANSKVEPEVPKLASEEPPKRSTQPELTPAQLEEQRAATKEYLGYPIDTRAGAEQCVSAGDKSACSAAYVEFEKDRSRQEVFGGPITLADLEEPRPRSNVQRTPRPEPEPSALSWEGIKRHEYLGSTARYLEENIPHWYEGAEKQVAEWYKSSPIAAWRSPEPSFAEHAQDVFEEDFAKNQNAPGNAVSEQLLKKEGERRFAETPLVAPSSPVLARSEPPQPLTQYPITSAERAAFELGPKPGLIKTETNINGFNYYMYVWTPYRFKQTMQWFGF